MCRPSAHTENKFPPQARKTSGTLGMASQASLSNFFKVARPSIFVGTPATYKDKKEKSK